MPDLEESLVGKDYGYLRIIVDMWGLDINSLDTRAVIREITGKIIRKSKVLEMENRLSEEAITALRELHKHQGRLPWSQFIRTYGELREMGPGRRDRDKPFLNPISTTEVLWYRGLIQRGIFDTERGPVEFAFIPDDLLMMFSFSQNVGFLDLGRRAKIKEIIDPISAGDQVLDHACTLLAGLRIPVGDRELQFHWVFGESWPYLLKPVDLKVLIYTLGLISEHGETRPQQVRDFLETDRNQALYQIATAWMLYPDYDDLRRMPGFKIEGEWRNEPLQTKKFFLDLMRRIPVDEWWNLNSFIEAIRQGQPDFQRPAGDYDSWYIRDGETGDYLRGFENWDRIDGAVLRYMIAGPLFWLGMVELAFSPTEMGDIQRTISAFRITSTGSALLQGECPDILSTENDKVQIRSDGQIGVPRLSPRPVRYQVARFCRWEEQKEHVYHYRITPESLARAAEQGLKVNHLLSILKKNTEIMPPGLVRSLQRWEQRGTETHFEQVTILRVGHPEILQSLKKTKATRFLGDPLGPTAIVVKPGSITKLRNILAEMGFLAQTNIEEGSIHEGE